MPVTNHDLPFIWVRFRSGEIKRLDNEIKKDFLQSGYPDIYTYLTAKGIESQWCEEMSKEDSITQESARRVRIDLQRRLQLLKTL